MKRRVVHGVDFVAAVREDLGHLLRSDRLEWIALLEADLDELERLVVSFPRAGKLMAQRGKRELRSKLLRRTPFVVWYATEPDRAGEPITFLRLYHARQKAPRRPRW